MSYTYLLELGEESSAECFSDIPQSVLSNLNLTAEKSYSKDNETASCQDSQSGMMSAPSTANLGAEKSMLSAEDSLAKTSQAQEREPESQENEADSGEKWPESLAKYDLNTHSWRTHQCLLFEESTESLEIFPRWGMMHDGELWDQTMLGELIEEKEYGYLPTPKAGDHKKVSKNINYFKSRFKANFDLAVALVRLGMKQANNGQYGRFNPETSEQMMVWPIGQTDLKPLEMDKFQSWLQQHGEYLEENK
jgi:hypothetical protein